MLYFAEGRIVGSECHIGKFRECSLSKGIHLYWYRAF